MRGAKKKKFKIAKCTYYWYYYIYSFVKKAKKVAEKLPAVAKALHPTVGTVKPSARLGKVGVKTGVPIFMAVAKLGHLSGSTPCK